jgi:gentisate 1,2-dioxygenase
VQVAYVNPENGHDCQRILGYSALMLRPGETLNLPGALHRHGVPPDRGRHRRRRRRSELPPGRCRHLLHPRLRADQPEEPVGDTPSFVFIADDAPLQKKLGVYEVRN